MHDASAFKEVEEILDAVKNIVEDVAPFVIAPKQTVALTTLDAYRQAALATAVTLPLIVLSGGPPTISEPPPRRLEDHVPAQNQHSNIAHEARVLEAVGASVNLSVNVWDGVKVSDEESTYIQTYPPKTD